MILEFVGIKITDPVEVKPLTWHNTFIVDRQDLAHAIRTFSGLNPRRSIPSFTQSLHLRPGELVCPEGKTQSISCDMAAIGRLITKEYLDVALYVVSKRKTNPSYPDLTLADCQNIERAQNESFILPMNNPNARRTLASLIVFGESEE